MEIVFILIYIAIIGLIVEIATFLLQLTGIDKKVSRYQSISMLTNTGFTTDEAKLIADHPVRRKISAFLILFGAFSLAVLISVLSNYLSDDLRLPRMFIILIAVALAFLLLKTKMITTILRKKLNGNLEKHFEMGELPIKDVLYLKDNDFLTKISIFKDSSLIGKRSRQIIKDDEDIFLLCIERGEEVIRKYLYEETIKEGDVLFVYGNSQDIKRKFADEIKGGNEQTAG